MELWVSLDLEHLSSVQDEEILQCSHLTAGQLSIEARMLQDFEDEGIRVPKAVACDDQMLAMEYIELRCRSLTYQPCYLQANRYVANHPVTAAR